MAQTFPNYFGTRHMIIWVTLGWIFMASVQRLLIWCRRERALENSSLVLWLVFLYLFVSIASSFCCWFLTLLRECQWPSLLNNPNQLGNHLVECKILSLVSFWRWRNGEFIPSAREPASDPCIGTIQEGFHPSPVGGLHSYMWLARGDSGSVFIPA